MVKLQEIYVMRYYPLLIVFALFAWNASGQVMANPPDPIILCDVNNPGDQMEVFDMTIREDQIIGGQTNVVVTYHPTSGDALGNGGVIPNPTNFTNEFNPHTIFIRVQNVNNGNDWEITTLDLIVSLIPVVAEQPDDIVISEANSDGIAVFDLTINEGQALGDADPFVFNFTYYQSLADAETATNPIADPTAYTNLTNPQTIYVRMAPLEDLCDVEIYEFDIEVEDSLGIENELDANFNMYPNPGVNVMNIALSDASEQVLVEIFSSNGKMIFSEMAPVKNKKASLNISSVSEGVYFVKISSEGNSVFKKLIKK